MSIRWGIVGPGRIAAKLVSDFAHVPDATVLAVASRSADRASAFADKYGIERSYGSYREILADADVDVLYVATPHTHHLAIGLAAAEAGKALLVEKSFTATIEGAEALVDAVRRHRVFAMEAMWTRFQPAVVAARKLLDEGAIGTVRSVQADLGVTRTFDPTDRVFAHELGGGALLDLGVYVVSFAQMVLGNPTSVSALGSLEPSGVDADATLLLGFDEGRTATLMCSLHSPMPGHARIFGSTGWIDILPRFHHPNSFVLHRQGHDSEQFDLPALGDGFSHELIEVTEAIKAGRTESSVMPLDDTLTVQRALEDALGQLGVRFVEEPADI
ncbi:oxidoreductase [Mycobacterium dioxanotrophicus]|jgi:predicted dehydrogenase|uniref:Oxidoreductase n=1 Tax=Mycobacterium dioxanotrophicus TaxID=482462 RepID=A0A1Y0BY06_9MYCO|nr:Gfo/Idh/MocA family oxidoreductase [Mycobacterium dioxanotrophicus]ART67766.1 oxidoreductase [Mycobacterium dioxanotrophicus]